MLGACDELRRLGDRGLAFAVQSMRRARKHITAAARASRRSHALQSESGEIFPDPGASNIGSEFEEHAGTRELPAGDSRRAWTGPRPNRKV